MRVGTARVLRLQAAAAEAAAIDASLQQQVLSRMLLQADADLTAEPRGLLYGCQESSLSLPIYRLIPSDSHRLHLALKLLRLDSKISLSRSGLK